MNHKNAMIVHGGAPTAVINASMAGCIEQLQHKNRGGKIFAARYGSKGLLEEDFLDLTSVTPSQLDTLKTTPGTAIGTSRTPLYEDEYEKIRDVLVKHQIGYVFYTGGNGSMDACGHIWRRVQADGIKVVGIPKTVDNDIMVTDHAPGYASCANYVSQTVREISQDVKGLPIHIIVLEVMGRNTGWLAAASALARDEHIEAPHLLCFPEVPFNEDAFLGKAEALYKKYGGVIVIASEGLKFTDGTHIVPPIFKINQAVYFGDVSSHLANLIIKKLGIKARGEKPGILTRCATPYVTAVDVQEAVMLGQEAAKAALEGIGGIMVGWKRVSNVPYQVQAIHIPVDQVMQVEKTLPAEFMNAMQDDVTEDFLAWARPLVNPPESFLSFL